MTSHIVYPAGHWGQSDPPRSTRMEARARGVGIVTTDRITHGLLFDVETGDQTVGAVIGKMMRLKKTVVRRLSATINILPSS